MFAAAIIAGSSGAVLGHPALGRRRNAVVIAVIDAAGQRPAERKFITFFYWLPFNFRFLAQQPPNKVESFLPPDSDPLT